MNPWWTGIFDLAIAGSLVVIIVCSLRCRHYSLTDALYRSLVINIFQVIYIALIITFLATALLVFRHGNFMNLLAWAHRYSYYISPPVINVGSVHNNTSNIYEINFENISNSKIRIIGYSSSYECIEFEHIPIEVDPHSEIKLNIKTRFIGVPGSFVHRILIYIYIYIYRLQ